MVILFLVACGSVLLDNPDAQDRDGDGVSLLEGDCDDQDPGIGAPVVGCEDRDRDGWTTAQGDCDDLDPERSPVRPEICGDGIDQDCDTDDPECGAWGRSDLRALDVSVSGPAWPERAGLGAALAVHDGDGDGQADLLVGHGGGVWLFTGPLDGDVIASEAESHEGTAVVGLVAGEGVSALDADGRVWRWHGDAVSLYYPPEVVDGTEVAAVRADLDGDGTVDLLWAHPDGGLVRVDDIDGERAETLESRTGVSATAVLDLDGDGWLDVVLVQPDAQPHGSVGGEVVLLHGGDGVADGSWTAPEVALSGTLASAPTLLDGAPGFVVGDAEGDLWRGGELVGSEPLVRASTGLSTGALAAAGGTVAWLDTSGDSAAGLGIAHDITALSHADGWLHLERERVDLVSLALGDLNGDGLPDVVGGSVNAADGRGRVGLRFEGLGP